VLGSLETIDYLMTLLGWAKQHHLTIRLLGSWNQRGYDTTWYERLHATLAK